MRVILIFSSAFLLAACAGQEAEEETGGVPAETTRMEAAEVDTPGGPVARAEIRDAQGNPIGVVRLREIEGGVELSGTLRGLPPGAHGFHIHETGLCEPPAFESAGGHFNPGGAQHGFDQAGGPHAGDLRNLEASEDGTVALSAIDSLVTLREGPGALLDEDGSALVIHRDPDDYRSQPSGASGDRIACGVIEG